MSLPGIIPKGLLGAWEGPPFRAAMETLDSLRAVKFTHHNHLWLHVWGSFSGQRTSLGVGFSTFLSGDKALSLEEEDLGFSFISASYSPCDLE